MHKTKTFDFQSSSRTLTNWYFTFAKNHPNVQGDIGTFLSTANTNLSPAKAGSSQGITTDSRPPLLLFTAFSICVEFHSQFLHLKKQKAHKPQQFPAFKRRVRAAQQVLVEGAGRAPHEEHAVAFRSHAVLAHGGRSARCGHPFDI